MSAASPPPVSLGFLTVVENEELGLLGGYLLLNPAGRPLEFHCTAPVKANRTQAILFGPTLRAYLCGELIGQTLLAASKLTPLVVCTDCEHVLAARDFSRFPLVLVEPAGASSASPDCRSFSPFLLGRNQACAAPRHASDEEAIRQAWPPQAEQLDLLEPFERIHTALAEAQIAARQAA
jgi:hypothetical protein